MHIGAWANSRYEARCLLGGEYQIVIITDGARSLPYKGATKKSAKKKNESEMALHCIASMCTNTDVNPAGLKDRDRDRKREES